MKQLMAVGVMTLALAAGAQQTSLTDACARIGEAIANPAVMSSTVRGLSAADQQKFVAQVNAAIAKMPGSPETKAAAAVDANRAAVSGAQKGGLTSLLAEVFATAPLESLPAINEIFASDLFNRAANPSVSYTDEQFVDLAKKSVEAIAARNADVDNGNVRTGFAILMFVRASNGTPANLADVLAEALPQDVRSTAKTEWFPAALAQGEDKSYDPMLVDVTLPNEQVVLRLAHAQSLEALLSDLSSADSSKFGSQFSPMPHGGDRGGIGSGLNNGLYRVPFNYNRHIFGTMAGMKGSGRKVGGGAKITKVPTMVEYAAGSSVPAGAKAGAGGIVVQTADGSIRSLAAGEEIPAQAKIVSGSSAGAVITGGGAFAGEGGVTATKDGKTSKYDKGKEIESGSTVVSGVVETKTDTKAGTGGALIVDPSGKVVVIDAGKTIPGGSTVIGGGSAAGTPVKVVVPPGTPIAPGGVSVGGKGKVVGPGKRELPTQGEPDPYVNQ